MTHTKCNRFIPCDDQETDEAKKENLIYGMTAIEWIMLISILAAKKREDDKNEQRD